MQPARAGRGHGGVAIQKGEMMQHLQPGHRVDWWRVIDDLRRTGLRVEDMSAGTGIPRSTLAGYKNLDVEPKHADGTALLRLWHVRHDGGVVPVIQGSVRNHRA